MRTFDREQPTDHLLASVRKQLQTDAAYVISNGGGKIARVRTEVEFGNGETIVFETRCELEP